MSVMELAKATVEDFQPLVGESFEVALEEAAAIVTTVQLKSATSLGQGMPGFRLPFSLMFVGPPDVYLQQQILWLTNPHTGTVPVFLVPVAGNSEQRTYEAVFN